MLAAGSVFGPPSRWAFWTLPVRVRALVLVVEAIAAALVLAAALGASPGTDDWVLVGWLLGLGMVHVEAATGIERSRRRVTGTAYFDLSSVWTFAAALLLPPTAAAVVVVGLYLHLWLRVWRPAGVPLHRLVYTTATVLLAAAAAHQVVGSGGPGPMAAAVLAGLAYLVVNNALVAAVVGLGADGLRLRELLGGLEENVLEVATVCLGGLTALALVTERWAVLLVLPPLLVLHRAVQARQLEEAATTDAKTGLLNAAAWRGEALRELDRSARAGTPAAVLIADLDHFKAVNDTYGHLVGDAVLAAVAAELRGQVRNGDLVARFGGEEFVVLLPGVSADELHAVADRIRRCVAALDVMAGGPGGAHARVSGLTISVGGATFPADATELEALLVAADTALYAAKRAGRDTVRIATAPAVPTARRPSG